MPPSGPEEMAAKTLLRPVARQHGDGYAGSHCPPGMVRHDFNMPAWSKMELTFDLQQS